MSEKLYTLLGIRADGFAPVVDLCRAEGVEALRDHAQAFLKEHASCTAVEVWLDSDLVARFDR